MNWLRRNFDNIPELVEFYRNAIINTLYTAKARDPYSGRMGGDEAVLEIGSNAGKQFDPETAGLLIEIVTKKS